MPTLQLTTNIAAPIERVFDLARCIDLHAHTASSTGEQAIAGVTSGLIGPGEEVTWRAKHLGVSQTLTVRITAFERPTYFADEMLRGAFQKMQHQHHFEATSSGTAMRDLFTYTSPWGLLGRLADWLFLERYLRNFLMKRNRILQQVAESEEWKQYLPQSDQT
ncbi:MAG: SRPBCC family protein [Planctomycetaceae bacterium]